MNAVKVTPPASHDTGGAVALTTGLTTIAIKKQVSRRGQKRSSSEEVCVNGVNHSLRDLLSMYFNELTHVSDKHYSTLLSFGVNCFSVSFLWHDSHNTIISSTFSRCFLIAVSISSQLSIPLT